MLIWWASTGRLQPWAMSSALYQSRNPGVVEFIEQLDDMTQRNWPTGR
ncbi:hypothetical protein Q3O43_27920 (plasmid) [Rhodococcus aetherivorans]|nr:MULTISPECIES: hypothetical protein [Rhodococcus]WKX01805.1 hypothetical protein Q3O43_27920 [Rhodococcus aetherivorans]